MFRWILKAFQKNDAAWLRGSLEYYDRMQRHKNLLDSRSFRFDERTIKQTTSKVTVHPPIPKLTPREELRVNAAIEKLNKNSRFSDTVYGSVMAHAEFIKRKNKAWNADTNSTVQ